MSDYMEYLREILPAEYLLENEPASSHTTFRIGGPCDVWAMPGSQEQIINLIKACRENEIPFLVLGRGSNVLFADEGFQGVVIEIGRNFDQVERKEEILTVSSEPQPVEIRANAGISLAKLSAFALKEGLSGLEFASGIPGSLGGAVVMNAGAYGGEMADVITEVSILKENLTVQTYAKEEMAFSYRHSLLKEEPGIVLDVTMRLLPGNKEEISAKMNELNSRRREKQPLEYPSAGSTFKRPEGYFAGKLIGEAGCSGLAVGDAEVSVKHNGFIINKGNAAACDVKKLIETVQNNVKEQSGIELEREVIYLPEESFLF